MIHSFKIVKVFLRAPKSSGIKPGAPAHIGINLKLAGICLEMLYGGLYLVWLESAFWAHLLSTTSPK